MKFSVDRKDFLEALNTVSVAASKERRPILQGVYIEANGSTLELQYNSVEVGIVAKIPCNAEESGVLVVNARDLTDFVKRLGGEAVTVSEQSFPTIKINDSQTSFTMLAMSAEDFPKVATVEGTRTFSINSSTLINLIERTAFATDKGDGRPIFKGCLFRVPKRSDDRFGNVLYMVATNTHRIAVDFESDPTACLDYEMNCIIPAQQLVELRRRLNPREKVQVDVDDRSISFTFENLIFVVRLINGTFPDHTKVTDGKWLSEVKFDSGLFLDAVQRVALVAQKNEYSAIRFNINDGVIEISASNVEDGLSANETFIPNILDNGASLNISFNVKYIIDVLKIFDGAKCVMRFNNGQPLSPVRFEFADNEDYIYVVTPVRS